MKRIGMLCLVAVLMSSTAFAFLYEVEIMTSEQVHKLSEAELSKLYVDAMIEREASATFHGRAGFSPKEYNAYKGLLGLIVRIRQEMLKRELDPPPIGEWLK